MVNPTLTDGRSLSDFKLLKPAEQKLLDACRKGEIAYISEQEQRPTEATEENTISASFLRFLALGGDEHAPIHEKGVQIWGAWVEGELNFEGETLSHGLRLTYCHLNTTPNLRDSVVHGCLLFQVCHVEGLEADRMKCSGTVFLNCGFIATGEVSLAGAQIGGDLECSGSMLDGMNGYALLAENMTVAGMFFFLNLTVKGVVSLVSAKVGSLEDDLKSWPEGGLNLDGFVYDRLSGTTPKDAETRLKWLDKQLVSHAGLADDGKSFKPQPWRQLQKVLYDMGHMRDVRLVSIAFEDRRHLANLIGQAPESWNKTIARLYRKISRCFHCLYGVLLSYGYYSPSRLIVEMMIVWLACGIFYLGAARNGVFAPSNPLVFQNSEYDVCKADNEKAQAEMIKAAYGLPSVQGAGNWYLCKDLREEYTGFSPLAYSLDLILPLVDLQQENDWAPMIPTPEATWIDELKARSLKHVTRLVMWFEILFGWVSSLLLVAVVSGLTKRREE